MMICKILTVLLGKGRMTANSKLRGKALVEGHNLVNLLCEVLYSLLVSAQSRKKITISKVTLISLITG